jgi:hypothetical protein
LKPVTVWTCAGRKIRKIVGPLQFCSGGSGNFVKKKINTFSILPCFSESELMRLALSHWDNHIDPKDDIKSAF